MTAKRSGTLCTVTDPPPASLGWRRVERDAAALGAALVGFAFLIAGITMLVVPGPGMLVIAIGLAILATQFAWAKRLLSSAEGSAKAAIAATTSDRRARTVLALSGALMVLGGSVAAIALPGWRIVAIFIVISGAVSLVLVLPAVQNELRAELDQSPNHGPL